MASTPEVKIDETKAEAAAAKAYAQAAEQVEVKSAPAPAAKAAAPAPAVAKAAAPFAKAVPVAAKKAKPAKKVAKAARPAAAKAVAPVKKAVAKPAPIRKAAVKKAAPKKAVKPTAPKTATKLPTISKLKDTIMATTKTTTEDFAGKFTAALTDAQSKAKAAFEKSQAAAAEYGEFSKGNLDALVASGKVLAAGLQDMGKAYVADAKAAFETLTADVKEVAAVKSPTDFFKLQGEILRRNFDAAVAAGSKNSESIVKLANDAFAPISGRVSLAIEKVKKAA